MKKATMMEDVSELQESFDKGIELIRHERFFIAGQWVDATGSEVLQLVDPATEEVYGSIPAGTVTDVERSVEAARAAFPSWSQSGVEERVAALERIAEGLGARRREIAEVIAREMGMPLRAALVHQASLPPITFQLTASLLAETRLEEDYGKTRVVREPIGVCALITPWNFPLHQIAGKVAPALAAGCTVVLKPSEIAPLDANLLAEVIEAAELPPGVFNLVHGTGPVVGEALAAHPDVDMISITGSTRAGVAVARAAAETVKRVTQELGGKSVNLLLEDADFPRAVRNGVSRCFLNSGQACNAPSRMLVPRTRYEEAVELAREAAAEARPGDPFDPDTTLGPLASRVQYERVQSLIEKGVEEGARLIAGGPGRPEGLDRGFFARPTIFVDVHNDMTIAREEIFGPVLCMIPYRDEEEAIRIANDSEYGLSGSVWGSPDHARAVARQLRTGQVHLNGARFDPHAPFGGYKRSGNGREFGRWGLEEYLEVKAILGYDGESETG